MSGARRTAGMWLGAFAGGAGIEHGYFELLQGGARPPGLTFPSIGEPCIPKEVWHGCEPAISLLPDLFITGLIALALGLVMLAWSFGARQHRFYGVGVALLSLLLLGLGGGVVPPVIGLAGGIVAMLPRGRSTPGRASALLSALWPWPLVALFALLALMVLLGTVAAAVLAEAALVLFLAMVLSLVLTVLSAWAWDKCADVAIESNRRSPASDPVR
jgi:hypothetical protein